MFTRKLGRSNIEVSAMGMGCYAIGGQFRVENGQQWGWTDVDDKESVRAIHAAMDLGVNFFDTAQAYGIGHSESIIGKAIKGRRDKVVLATKFGKLMDEANQKIMGSSIESSHLRQSLEDSLLRFGTDYIDLFQWHESNGALEDLPRLLDLLDELVDEGKIRYYGWSTDDTERATLMAQRKNCVAIQHRVHVFENSDNVSNMLAVCDAQNLASINRSPLMMGILTGKFNEKSAFDEGDIRHSIGIDFQNERFGNLLTRVESVREVFTSQGRTPAQGALAWIWARSPRTIPIPGFKNTKQATENARAMDFGPLTKDQFHQVEEIMGRAQA
ncbi:MAG: aldo/keto reductase [Chloroflexota bacterium]|nr:MAG: aldo/keto reductase [Chloroflexota bacterium]